jgi:hypothetical protein
MQIMCTHFIFLYDYILIQEHSYEHVSNYTHYLQNVPPVDDVY